MGERVTPATKSVGKPDGLSKSRSTITTPNHDDLRKWAGKENGTIMGKK